MSIGEVEEKFNLTQLVMMTEIQDILAQHQKEQMEKDRNKGGGRKKNKGRTKDEQNARAFAMLSGR